MLPSLFFAILLGSCNGTGIYDCERDCSTYHCPPVFQGHLSIRQRSHDGPDKIQRLARRLNGLYHTLLQIAELVQSQGLISQDECYPLLKDIRPTLHTCTDGLQRLQLGLSKLKCSNDKGIRRAWSAVKPVLGSRDLTTQMPSSKSMCRNLALQLQIIGR